MSCGTLRNSACVCVCVLIEMSVLRVDELFLRELVARIKNVTNIYIYANAEPSGTALRATLRCLQTMQTADWKQANWFLIPSWRAMPSVLKHAAFQTASNVQKHILFHTSGDSAFCSAQHMLTQVGYSSADAAHVWKKMQSVHFFEFGGRRDCGGVCHIASACCRGCYAGHDGTNGRSIVLPPEIPFSMHRTYDPHRRRRALFSMDMDYELAVRNLQVERVHVTRFFEMARLNRTRKHYRSHLVPLVLRTPGQYETLMGVHAAGFGIWSARLFAYLVAGVIPILFTDGVVLPFERVLRYETFLVKLALERAIALDYSLLAILETMERLRMQPLHHPDWFDTTINKALAAAPWIDWHSTDALRNPVTLMLLELWCRGGGVSISSFLTFWTRDVCRLPSSRLAFKEVWPVSSGSDL